MKKIIFLKTSQNLVWTSMEEILPCIQESWLSFSKRENVNFVTIDVDSDSPQKYIKDFLESDLIVVSAFNGKMAQYLNLIRGRLKVDSPWYFYLHGLATVGLWPLHALGLGDLLTTNDRFIGTCDGDKDSLLLAHENAYFKMGTFFTKQNLKMLPKLNDGRIQDLVYVGRISRQKNLHSLLMAFKLLKKDFNEMRLHIFGKEDNLGSPNMGQRELGYLDELKSLVKEQSIADVCFHGFVKRDEIYKVLQNKAFLFCGLSLHSDENFGMAALSALENGGKLVLTNWGGHQNFISRYPERVCEVKVRLGSFGPFINITDLVKAFKIAIDLKDPIERMNFATQDHAIELIQKGIADSVPKKEPLKTRGIVQDLLDFRKEHESMSDLMAQKIFTGFSDPNAHAFFKCYGAKKTEEDFSLENGYLLPWAKPFDKSEKILSVKDPHKGPWEGSLLEAKENGYLINKKELPN